MADKQLQMLIQLARADGILSGDEVAMITRIAERKGLSGKDISALFEQKSHYVPPCFSALDKSKRFEYLYTAVQLIKVDGRLYREEIRFVRAIFHLLGYADDVYCHFLIHVSSKESRVYKNELKKYIEGLDLEEKRGKK